MKTTFFLATMLVAGAVGAQDTIPECEAPLEHPLPADVPSAAEIAELAGCNSELIAESGDYVAAARCAWAERANGGEAMFAGSSMLLTIYANGWGDLRDFALARRLACEAGGAPAEIEGRLEHLAAIEAGEDTEPFDFCDDITSGYMMGFCSSREAEKTSAKREAELESLLAAWPVAHRNAWMALRQHATAFFDARIENEVDVSGTARGAMIVGETESLAQGLFDHLQAFERGQLPSGSQTDLAEADRRLNESYAKARAAAKPEETEDGTYGPLGTIRPDGIRDAERAWIPYRDAWVAFGKMRYPAVSEAAWKHFFTLEREKQLRELVEGI